MTSITIRSGGVNRWDDPSLGPLRADVLVDLWDHQPGPRLPRRPLEAPV